MPIISPLARRTPLRRPLACLAFILGSLIAADSGWPAVAVTEAPATISPLPALVAYASAHHVALGQFVPTAPDATPRSGDAVTFLVSLREKGRERQWLVDLQVDDMTAAERAAKPPPDMYIQPPDGRPQIWFSNQHRVALEIATTGAFSADPTDPPTIRNARVLLSSDYLGLGLDRSCRLIMDLVARYGPNPNPKPVLSAEDDRTAAGFFPALVTFFQAAQSTPGLSEILWDITQKPSLWSLARRGGRVDTNLNMDKVPVALDSAAWGAADAGGLLGLPLTVLLNDRPALVSALFITSARPPLLACAGIIGIDAEPPGKPERHLSIRLVASRRAEPAPR